MGATVTALLIKALLTAVVVAALLSLAKLSSRRLAGLLAGLPTVTGPALAWLALDQGAPFAAEATAGVVAAGASCAAFAVGYAYFARRSRWPWALVAGLLGCLVPLPVLEGLRALDWGLLVAVVLVCGAAIAALRESAVTVSRERSLPRPPRRFWRDVWLAAAVSGLVSGAVCALAGQVGAFWAGVLSSPPLIAAVVAVQLHATAEVTAVARFLRGYTAGLIGRSAFAAMFGLLVLPAGVLVAVVVATLVATVTGGWLALQLRRGVAVSATGP
jgi:hypothetical protein